MLDVLSRAGVFPFREVVYWVGTPGKDCQEPPELLSAFPVRMFSIGVLGKGWRDHAEIHCVVLSSRIISGNCSQGQNDFMIQGWISYHPFASLC